MALTIKNQQRGINPSAELTAPAAIGELAALSLSLREQFYVGAGRNNLTSDELQELNHAVERVATELLSLIRRFRANEDLDRKLIALQNAAAAASVTGLSTAQQRPIKFNASITNALIANMVPMESYGESEITYRLSRLTQSRTRKAINERIVSAGILKLEDGNYTRTVSVMRFELTTTTPISKILKAIRYELVGSGNSSALIQLRTTHDLKAPIAKMLALTATLRGLLGEPKERAKQSEEQFISEIKPGECISANELILALERILNLDKPKAKQKLAQLIAQRYFKRVMHTSLPDALLRIDNSRAKKEEPPPSAAASADSITIKTPHCERSSNKVASLHTTITATSLVEFITKGYHDRCAQDDGLAYRPQTDDLRLAVALLIIDGDEERLKRVFNGTNYLNLPNLKSFGDSSNRSCTRLRPARQLLIKAIYDYINAEIAEMLYAEALKIKQSRDPSSCPALDKTDDAKAALFEVIGARNQGRDCRDRFKFLQAHFAFNDQETTTSFLQQLRFNCKPAVIELLEKTCILMLLARKSDGDHLNLLKNYVSAPENSRSWNDIAMTSPIKKLLFTLPQLQKILSQRRPSDGGAN